MTAAIVQIVGALLASMALSWCAIAYAHRRQMLDLPGARRSHQNPTPRGGGIAPVLVILVGGTWLASTDVRANVPMLVCVCGFAAVAAVGWADDHRPLSPVPRLAVHLAAAIALALALSGTPDTGSAWIWFAFEVLFTVILVNVWNFMDGIDGIATSQAILVLGFLAVVGSWMAETWRGLCVLSLAALAGFLPFNAPRARIFLGDVGSGALGFLMAALLLRAVDSGALPWPLALLPPSAFLIDAGMTLISRIARRKAWWLPHREHFYQWLVRRGRMHAQVAGWYAMWTLGASVVAAILLASSPLVRLAVTIAILLSGQFLWLFARKRLWSGARLLR